MTKILDADFPELPEDHWWKKELSRNYRGIRHRDKRKFSGDGYSLLAIHHETDDFDDGLQGWGVYKSHTKKQLAQGLTAQEAVNFAYALFVLGEQDEE